MRYGHCWPHFWPYRSSCGRAFALSTARLGTLDLHATRVCHSNANSDQEVNVLIPERKYPFLY